MAAGGELRALDLQVALVPKGRGAVRGDVVAQRPSSGAVVWVGSTVQLTIATTPSNPAGS